MTIYTGTIGERIDELKRLILFDKGNHIPDEIKGHLSIESTHDFLEDSYSVSLVYKNNDICKVLRTITINRYDLMDLSMNDALIEMLELLICYVLPKNKNLEEYKKLLEDK